MTMLAKKTKEYKTDKPTYQYFYPDGKLEYQVWYKNGQYHRDKNLPAYQCFYSNGKLEYQEWYKYGVKVTKEFCKQDFSKIDPKTILTEKNTQKRMMYIQLIGLDKIIDKLDGKSLGISEDKQYELLSFDDIFIVPMKVLKMRCPSTNVYYFVSVKPECNSIEEVLDYYYGGVKYDFIGES